jgi:hypothetical protein
MRALSDLQKQIIKLAHTKPQGTYVSNRDVLREVYGYPVHGKYTENLRAILASKGSSLNEYKAANVAVAKSFNRLCKRDLVIREYNAGVALTDKGVKVAESLNG